MSECSSWGNTWLIVTGASRGLGAAICNGFAGEISPSSVVVGIARSTNGLENTRTDLIQSGFNCEFVPISADLSQLNAVSQLEPMLKNSFSSVENVESCILVHNAGSLGNTDYLRNIHDANQISEFYHFNIGSVIPLTKVFLDIVKTASSVKRIHIINITSLAAIMPISSWGMYCSAKAARDMLFKVMAKEESTVKILNYAPGPLDNDMMVTACTETKDPESKAMFQDMKKSEKLLKPKDSVKKLIQIILEDKYTSGDHIDYYD